MGLVLGRQLPALEWHPTKVSITEACVRHTSPLTLHISGNHWDPILKGHYYGYMHILSWQV
ncbi:hypothetical protein E2C01_099089 [Portunus trituberculatus]|uniref:Uncharacterized protein n=1 Tax=Portunus trituberculatus TaxID=210409 RepID=A0A5B7K2X7_PORTR|nr:hypothetical protein [Portunus trituberculatus]